MTSGQPLVVVGLSPIQGRGLFAMVRIDEGEPIFPPELVERSDDHTVVMTAEEFGEFVRTNDRYSARAIGDGLHRVSLTMSLVDYGNHSCDPNMWLADDHTTLVARRRIAAGEEITSDYALWSDTPGWRMPCNCGTDNCRRVITGEDWKRPDLQDAYLGHWPAFLEDRIARMSQVPRAEGSGPR